MIQDFVTVLRIKIRALFELFTLPFSSPFAFLNSVLLTSHPVGVAATNSLVLEPN
jgi:hypothetical protein